MSDLHFHKTVLLSSTLPRSQPTSSRNNPPDSNDALLPPLPIPPISTAPQPLPKYVCAPNLSTTMPQFQDEYLPHTHTYIYMCVCRPQPLGRSHNLHVLSISLFLRHYHRGRGRRSLYTINTMLCFSHDVICKEGLHSHINTQTIFKFPDRLIGRRACLGLMNTFPRLARSTLNELQ